MPIEVILPRVDMDMATGKISKWFVQEGDAVARGVPIFEIDTDKAAMDVESPGDGVIANISAGEGVDIPVGTVVAFIYRQGEAVAELSPAARPEARAPVEPQAPAPSVPLAAAAAIHSGGAPRATPLARRLARERGIFLPSVPGSGPRARIQANDVRSFSDPAKPLAIAGGEADGSAAISDLYREGSYDVLPIGRMRRIIADRLTRSKQTVPHFYLSLSCDLTQLLDIRARLNERAPLAAGGQPQWKLSINDFVIKALALALRRVPEANVTWTEQGILRHRTCDVGVAVAVDGGLYTPVIRSTEDKSLSQISLEMRDLAAKARAHRLQPSDYQGGTTAVSNLGMYGIEEFTAIINPPQATIFAIGAAVERPVGVKGQIVLRNEMKATLSCDHRAVDGALGAELLAAFRLFIEEPALMLA